MIKKIIIQPLTEIHIQMESQKWKINLLGKKPAQCNTNKCSKFSPIINENGAYVIDAEWLEKQPAKYRQMCAQEFPNLIIPDNKNPLEKFLVFHVAYYDMANFQYLFDDMTIIDLSANEANKLIELYLMFQMRSDNTMIEFTDAEIPLLHPNFAEKIELVLEKYGDKGGTFIKTSFKSGKHGKYALRSCFTICDVINCLIHSTDVLYSLFRDGVKLVARPWNPAISRDNEYRLFVFDGELMNISSTYPSQPMNIADEQHAQKILANIWGFWLYEIKAKMLANEHYVQDYCADIFVSDDGNRVGLIEINSGGKFSTCSSCLFHYEVDMPSYEFRAIKN